MMERSRFERSTVLKHEHFEELCATASSGQASGAELAELREHLEWCSKCQERYSEFLSLNAVQYAKNVRDEVLSLEVAAGSIDSALLRQRFLKKAVVEGIVFSGSSFERPLPDPQLRLRRSWNWPLLFARAAAGLILFSAVGVGGYYFAVHQTRAKVLSNGAPATQFGWAERQKSRIAKLEQQNANLTAQVSALNSSLGLASAKLSELESRGSISDKARQGLSAQLRQREDEIANLQTRIDQAQNALRSLRADYEKAQSNVNSDQAQMVADQIEIRELSERLTANSADIAREKELLTAGRDIRDLMAARNLHIVDVFDMDPRGKRRPAFGRIFYTEGKSLLFYAYDLPDSRLRDAGYHYRIWGKKAGSSQHARNLGIFFSDDKAQKRWVFRFDDPKVLDEIDSIFVTLEPPDGSPTQPKGDKLLSAYLKGPPNHP
jgi:DNA repair exonuclease SbcCD ATPase subunit